MKVSKTRKSKLVSLIRSKRKESSVEALAAQLDITPRAVFNWLNGQSVPSDKVWAKAQQKFSELAGA